jgi:hypothetical protein
MNEDVLWGLLLESYDFGTAPKHVEQQFSAELIDSQRPYGIHNYAHYHSLDSLQRLLQCATHDFFCKEKDILDFSGALGVLNSNWKNLLKRFPEAKLPRECTLTSFHEYNVQLREFPYITLLSGLEEHKLHMLLCNLLYSAVLILSNNLAQTVVRGHQAARLLCCTAPAPYPMFLS